MSRETVAGRRNILGIAVTAFGWDAALAHLHGLLTERRFTKISFLNAHNANVACADEEYADALDDFLVLPDGIGVDIASKVLYGEPFPANLNGTDFVPALLKAETRPLTIGLLGAKRANAEAAAGKFSAMAPQHTFQLIHDGFFTAAQEPEIVARIGRLKPDILLVAMGVPRQELWISRHIRAEHCTAPIAVGALLDFVSGVVPRAPDWVIRLRMEWVYRLLIEPKRLWRRYVLGNPAFLGRVLLQKLGMGRGARRKAAA